MRKTKKIAVVGGTVGILMAGGVAFAAWTSTGNDTGSVAAGHQVDLGVEVGTATDLQPTLTRTITVKVTNNNKYPVAVDSVVFKSADSSVSGGDGIGCSLDDIVVHPVTTSSDYLAPSGDAGDNTTYQADVEMIADASPDCQNATFNLNYAASAHSVAVQ
jgi:hypothetical protein